MAELPEVFRAESLPEKVEDLAKFVLIAPEVFRAQQAEIRAMEKIGVAKEIMEIKAQDLNRAGQMYLDAEVRLGRITAKMKPTKGGAGFHKANSSAVPTSKESQLKEIGLSKQRASELEKMASHEDCVELEKKQSEAENRLPSNRNVLRLISEKEGKTKEQKFHEEMEIIDAQIEEAEEIIGELEAQPLIDAFEMVRFFNIRERTPELMKYYGNQLEKVTREIIQMMHQVQIRAIDLKEVMEEQ